MKRIFLALISFLVYACSPDNFSEVDTQPSSPVSSPRGLFVINEGLFNQGNAEITYIDEKTGEVKHNFFQSVNGYSPGDILMDAIMANEEIYLSVNNSNRIYVLDRSWKVKTQINITQPRYLLPGKKYVYVSSLYRPFLYLIDINKKKLVDSMYASRPLEQLMWVNGFIWGIHWSSLASSLPNRYIMIIDSSAKKVVDSIEVGKEPNSMVQDKEGNIWVLCSGGYLQEEPPTLWKINPITRQPQKIMEFNQGNDYPSSLNISATRDTLFFINKNIYCFSIQNLSSHLVYASGIDILYSLWLDPDRRTWWVCNVKDYVHQGEIMEINAEGQVLKKFPAGTIPRKILFIR
ncbi:MAG: DUF5074 domain-containing protein [Bacteroidales bacterium]|nr:DUF5074 domain-containing protein [Bacteroidales bacterium]